jgi:molybdopterin molybdotransferase
MNSDLDFKLTRKEVLKAFIKHWQIKVPREQVLLAEALGRVSAEDIYAVNTLPVYRSSRCDGIAVRSSDFENGVPDTSTWIRGRDFVQADTGDDFPDEFDAVIPVEDITYNEKGQPNFAEDLKVKKGDRIRPQGTLVKEKELLLKARTRLRPEHLTVLALGGIHQLPVLKKPKVVFIPTGNELIPAGLKPERGQNIEANSLMVSSFLKEWGAEPICYPIIKDNPQDLEKALDMALEIADIVIINGGSSKGEEDYNVSLLKKRASFACQGVKAAPGRPAGVAIIEGKAVINLPGPPIAAFLVLDWAIKTLVYHYYGLPTPIRPKLKVRLSEDLKESPHLEMLYRLHLTKKGEEYFAVPVRGSKSLPYNLVMSDALFVAPLGAKGYKKGTEIEVELLRGLEDIRVAD